MANFFHNPLLGVGQKPVKVVCPWCKQWWPMGTPDETLQEHVREEHPIQWVEWAAWQVDLRHLEKMFLMGDERE